MKLKKIYTFFTVIFFVFFGFADITYTYDPIEYIYFDATQWHNIDIPYKLSNQNISYGWELTFSNLTSIPGRCGSLVGVYNGNRSGYFYSNPSHGGGTASAPKYRVCVGNADRDTWYQIGGRSEINTLHAEYTHNGSTQTGTYFIKDTLGVIGNGVNGTWAGDYCTGVNFSLVACARYNYGNDGREAAYEFCSFKFYRVKIWENDASGNPVVKFDLVPVIRYGSDGNTIVCVRNNVDGSFLELSGYAKTTPDVISVSFNQDNPTTAGTDHVSAVKGGSLPQSVSNLPTKTGYVFCGYYTQQNGGGTQVYNEEGIRVNNLTFSSNQILYAYWFKHEHNSGSVLYYPWKSVNSLPTDDKKYVLLNNISLSNVTLSSDVTLCLDGHSISGGTITVPSGKTLTILDHSDKNTGYISNSILLNGVLVLDEKPKLTGTVTVNGGGGVKFGTYYSIAGKVNISAAAGTCITKDFKNCSIKFPLLFTLTNSNQKLLLKDEVYVINTHNSAW